MAAKSHFTMTETDFATCFQGSLAQARAHGLDTTEPKLLKFLEQQATVAGWKMAENRSFMNAGHSSQRHRILPNETLTRHHAK